MIFKILTISLFVSFAAFFTGCKSVKQTELKEITLEDRNSSGEITITTEDLQPKQISASGKSKIEPAQALNDKSELTTMFDGYGNKTETRRFKGHSRLDMVLVRTSVDKVKQVFVYGFGDIVTMPADFAESGLRSSADEIADAAELKQTRAFKPLLAAATPAPVTKPQVKIEETAKPKTVIQETVQPAEETQNEKVEESVTDNSKNQNKMTENENKKQ